MKKIISAVLLFIMIASNISFPVSADTSPQDSMDYYEETSIMLASASSNEAEIYDFIINTMKLNTAAACGIIANLYCENASFEPERRQGGGTGYGTYDDGVGYGICQWTYWKRKKNLKTWCDANTGKNSWKTLQGQLKFMQHELNGSSTLKKLKNVKNNEDGAYKAGYTFCMNYEGPKYKDSPYKGYPTESDYRGDIAKTKYWVKYGKTKPSAPIIKSAKAASSKKIEIEWGSVSNADKYVLERRRSDEEKYKTVETTTKTSFTDSGLTPGKKYYYKVHAVNSAGNSADSPTYQTHTKPEPPEISKIARDSKSQLTVSWNKISGATHYRVYCRKSKDGGDWVQLKDVTGTSYTHTTWNKKPLETGTKYSYRVEALIKDEEGNKDHRSQKTIGSGQSATISGFTLSNRPDNNIDNDNPTHVILKWDAISGDESYTYEVYRDGKKIAGDINGRSYTDKTAVPGTIYKYEIRTKKLKGAVWKSGEFYAAPKITDEIFLSVKDSSSMQINWNKPKGASNNLVYVIKRDGNEVGRTTDTWYVDGGLTAGKKYNYYVQVRDKNDNYVTSTYSKSAILQILPTSIGISKTSASLNIGETMSLSSTLSPNNCTNTSVTWSSSNTNVASVSSNGVVTANAAGNTTITVTTSNGKSASCSVSVKPAECSHTYGDWITEINPTCTTDGSRYRVCTKCGEGKEVEAILATGHSYSEEWETTKEPTCIENGEKAHICTVCGDKIDNTTIDALGHSFPDEWTLDKAATCSEMGTEIRICSVCGEKEERTTDYANHEEEITAETPTTPDGPGSRTYTCKICGESHTEEFVPEINQGMLEIKNENGSPIAGGELTLPVTISDNPGIAGFRIKVTYDKSALVPKSVTAGDALTFGSMQTNLDQPDISPENLDEVWVVWECGEGNTDMTNDGVLFNITFDVKSDAAEGEYNISLDYEKGEITTLSPTALFNDVMPETAGDTITIADIVRGDINLDRHVNSRDGVLLTQYLAHWDIPFSDKQKQAADVFVDSRITIKDSVRLSQILAGYDVSKSVEETPMVALAADNSATVTVDSFDASAGEYIDIPVSITDNPGISGFSMMLNYDKDKLTPIAIEKSDTLINGSFESNLIDGEDISTLEYVTATWTDADDLDEDGMLFSVQFKVNEDASLGETIPVEIYSNEIELCDQNLENIGAVTEQGTITVTEYTEDYTETDFAYMINGITMKTADGTVCETLPVNGDFDLEVGIESTAEEFTPATMLVAAYDENSCLISLKSVDITEEMLTAGVCGTHIDESDTAIDKVSVLVWDSINGMIPLAETINK